MVCWGGGGSAGWGSDHTSTVEPIREGPTLAEDSLLVVTKESVYGPKASSPVTDAAKIRIGPNR